MSSKKYYTISEVKKLCGINLHQLRYLEIRFPELVVLKIKGRRYYSQENIEFITLKLPILSEIDIDNVGQNSDIIKKINSLISKFNQIKLKLHLTN
jgi:DNA-binding transcriptional MerR regulator